MLTTACKGSLAHVLPQPPSLGLGNEAVQGEPGSFWGNIFVSLWQVLKGDSVLQPNRVFPWLEKGSLELAN